MSAASGVAMGRNPFFGKPRDLAEKLQIPSSKHKRNTKHPVAKGDSGVLEGLRFGASLVFGCWSLVLHSSIAQKDAPVALQRPIFGSTFREGGGTANRLLTAIDATRGAGLGHDHFRQQRQVRFQPFPNPECHI